MELHTLRVFSAVATERSFSRAAGRVYRTQPAVSLAVQKLERELTESLVDRSGREVLLTDAGRIVLEYASRFAALEQGLRDALVELRDKTAGRLAIGANESTTIYLLQHLAAYRKRYPRVKIQVRRSLSSLLPSQIIDGELELGVISYDPGDSRLSTMVIYTDHLAFIVSPRHRLAGRKSVSIKELGMETFIAHNVVSPYRENVLREFRRRRVPLQIDMEMPTVETICKLVQRDEGVAFLPRMCVEQELRQGTVKEVAVKETKMERKMRLVFPSRRRLSYAARAFLEMVQR